MLPGRNANDETVHPQPQHRLRLIRQRTCLAQGHRYRPMPPFFAPLNSSAAFKRSDKMYVRASKVSISVRAVFSHPISLPLANQALHSPSLFCLIVHPFRIHPYCIYLVRLLRVHSYRTCVVGLFRTRFPCALSHANFRNARPIGLSQRLPNKLFCIHFHSTSRKSLHSKPERADAAQTMSQFCKKWQKFAVVNGLVKSSV